MAVEAPDTETYRLRRSADDFYARSLLGPVFYVTAWGLVLAASNYRERFGWLVAAPALVFLALGIARHVHRPPPPAASAAELRRWASAHWLTVHPLSALWGAVPAFVGVMEAHPDDAILIAVLATMAFCTAMSHAFAMSPWHARLSMLLLSAPPIAVFLARDELFGTGTTLGFYVLYLMANLRRTSKEYAHQLDTEVELLRSRAEVAQLSLTDSLTGLPNRRSYDVVWPQASSAAVRQDQPLSLLVLDLDHFKAINDRHGHLAGDACLQHFATILKQQISRESDFIARFGGEEFIALLPGIDSAEAKAVAERVREQVARSPCHFEALELLLTVSVGVAAVERGQLDTSRTFKHADEACYAAKKNGRNRVEVWVGPSAAALAVS